VNGDCIAELKIRLSVFRERRAREGKVPVIPAGEFRWRIFLNERVGKLNKYDKAYDFTELRDSVMHGRVLFPTCQQFIEFSGMIERIGNFIEQLETYNARAPVIAYE
jgi:hypothetical protein